MPPRLDRGLKQNIEGCRRVFLHGLVIINMDDNQLEMLLPFKGPFKGKGRNRRAVRQLESQMIEIRIAMEHVVDQYNSTFVTRPRPVNLMIHKRGKHMHPMLTWRKSIRGGSFFHLFGNEEGEALLRQLRPNTVRVMADFDNKRLILNFKSKVAFSALSAYWLMEEGEQAQAVWFDGSSRNPLRRTG